MNDSVFILNFHGIGQPIRNYWAGEEHVWIEEKKFVALLDEVKGRKDVLVTFDDGNISDLEIALPALQARGLKAHFFIVSDFVGQKGFLSINDVKTLHAAGMMVGNHGKRHCSWRGLAAGELREELVEAKDRLEQIIAGRIHDAACPYGDYDRRVLAHLRECGYERIYTSDGGRARKSGWLQPRNSVRCHSNAEDVRQLLGETGLSFKGLIRMCKRRIKSWR